MEKEILKRVKRLNKDLKEAYLTGGERWHVESELAFLTKLLALCAVGVTLKDKEETDFNYKGITYKNAESVTEFHKINGIKEVDGLFVDKKGRII